MEKEQFKKKHSEFLTKMHNDFYWAENEYKHGSNKKKRDAGYKKMQSLILTFKSYARINPEIVTYATADVATDQGKTFAWDEFVSTGYFERDLESLLSKLNWES